MPTEASVPSFCFVLVQRGRLSPCEPTPLQRSLDVDATHEVDVHVRLFVDAFLVGRPSEACQCKAPDRKRRRRKESAFCQHISNFLTAVSVCDSCLQSEKCRLYEFIQASTPLAASQVATRAWLDSSQSTASLFLDSFLKSEATRS